uniref:Uncharacterized protein n=1 Tax=Romanomermis culicivorax TaxID=13658 RepID=A0A915JPS2_ROMCU
MPSPSRKGKGSLASRGRSRSKNRSSRRSGRTHSEYFNKMCVIDVLENLRNVCSSRGNNEATIAEIEAAMTHKIDQFEIWKILIRGQMQNLCSQVSAERWSTRMAGGDAPPTNAKYAPLRRQKRFENEPFTCFSCFKKTGTLRFVGHGIDIDGVLKLLEDTVHGAKSESERRKVLETIKCWVEMKKMLSHEYSYCKMTTKSEYMDKIRLVDVLEALRVVCSKNQKNEATIAEIATTITYHMHQSEIEKLLIRGQMQNLCSQVGIERWSTKMTAVDGTIESLPNARFASLKRQKRFEDNPYTCFICLKSTGSIRLANHGIGVDGILRLLDDTVNGTKNADERRKAVEQLKCWIDLKKRLSPEHGIDNTCKVA